MERINIYFISCGDGNDAELNLVKSFCAYKFNRREDDKFRKLKNLL